MITEVKIWSWFFQHSWKSANLNIVQHLAPDFLPSEVSWYFLYWEVFPTRMVTAAVGKTFIWATSRERTPPLIACIASQLVALPPSLRHQQMRGSGLGGDSPTNNYPVSDFTLVQKPSAFTFCYRGQCWISLGFHDKFLCVSDVCEERAFNSNPMVSMVSLQ